MLYRKTIVLVAVCTLFLCSCKDTVSTTLPEYELNLSVEVEHNRVTIELSSVGDVNISDMELALNGSVLSPLFRKQEKVIRSQFNADDQALSGNNELVLRYQDFSQTFSFNLAHIPISRLDTAAADPELGWLNSNHPDFNIVHLSYTDYDREKSEYIDHRIQFVTSKSSITIPADFNAHASVQLYLSSCWGPEPTKQGYSKSDPLPVNFRTCSTLYTDI